MGFEPMPLSRWQLECHVLDRSTTVTPAVGVDRKVYKHDSSG